MAGIFSLLLVGLVVVGPIWISEKLEEVETAQEGIKTFSEVREEYETSSSYVWNNSTEVTGYIPYLESNSSNYGIYDEGGVDYYRCQSGTHNPSSKYSENPTYNYDGFRDIVTISKNDVWLCQIHVDVSGIDFVGENVNQVYYYFNISSPAHIIANGFMGLNSGYDVQAFGPTISWGGVSDQLIHENTITLSSSDLNDIASLQSTYAHVILALGVWYQSDNDNPSVIFDIQLSPEYYEESEAVVSGYWDNSTIYDNQTITTYEPYIQGISNPYNVHKVMMVFGSILIGITALIVSPLPIGESFDRFFPINNHQSDYTRKRTKRRRSR